MSFLSLLALSKVTSALLCSVRCSAMPVRKWDCRTAGRWGRRLHIQGFAAGVPASAAYPGHWSLTPGWEFACGPYAPERGCAQPSASGTAAPSRSIPRARLQQLCCCVQPTRVGMQPGTHPHSQQVPGDQPTPLPLPSLGAVLPPDSCCFQGWPNPGCWGGGLPGLLHHLDLRGFNVFLPSPCSRCSV